MKLSIRGLSDLRLSGLHPFDNMPIIYGVKNKSKIER